MSFMKDVFVFHEGFVELVESVFYRKSVDFKDEAFHALRLGAIEIISEPAVMSVYNKVFLCFGRVEQDDGDGLGLRLGVCLCLSCLVLFGIFVFI